jgi:hypothetical protein
VEKKLKDIKLKGRERNKEFDFHIYLSKHFRQPLQRDVDKMSLLLKEYRSFKHSLKDNYSEFNDDNYDTIEQIAKHINDKSYATISSNANELADLAVYLTYTMKDKSARGFAWSVFGNEIVQNMIEKDNAIKAVRVRQKIER